VPGLVAVALTTQLEFDEMANVDEAAADGGRGESTLDGFTDQSRRLLASAFVFGIAMLYGLYYRRFLTFLPEVLQGLQLFEPVTLGGRTFPPTKYIYAGLLTLGAGEQYVGGKLSDRIRTERALVAIFGGLVVVSLLFVPAADAGVVPFLAVCAALAFLVYMEVPVTSRSSRSASPRTSTASRSATPIWGRSASAR
jgi:nitrate/nitrite transporter NarK